MSTPSISDAPVSAVFPEKPVTSAEPFSWRMEVLNPGVLRLRDETPCYSDHELLTRYRIIRQDWPERRPATAEIDGRLTAESDGLQAEFDPARGLFALRDGAGAPMVRTPRAVRTSAAGGFALTLSLEPGERIHGLGDITRDRLDMRGLKDSVWVHNVKSYVPMPLFWSSRGWGLFIATTWRVDIDVGHDDANAIQIRCAGGRADLHWFVGASPLELVSRLTEITGRPCLLPKWAYAHTFVCNLTANAHEMMSDALTFRREGIPCDVIGLEPGWMSVNYDYTTGKKWHPERFYCSDWAPQDTFVAALKRLGFKLSLWLCCDYDLTWEEERQLKFREQKNSRRNGEASHHPDDFEKDPHFGHGPVLMDKLTVREEPWFDHLKKFVDVGARAFKLDGALQVNEHPDRRWGGFLDDAEMHNLYPVLLNKQMALGFRRHASLRPMVYSSGGYVGIQQFAATWAGDTGGGHKPLVSMLNHGMIGHSNTSCDMQVTSAEGVHFGFLQTWSQVNSWAYWRHPWTLGERLGAMFKDYARLRYRLLPYLYSLAHEAHSTGCPVMRSMPLVYPEISDASAMMHQYMLGPFFLVGAFSRKLFLPEGAWFDYWTGRSLTGGRWIECAWPENRGGPLFVKAGAILPQTRDHDYVGQRSEEALVVEVFPGEASEFVLCEDDGETFDHEKGAIARTRFALSRRGEETCLVVTARDGRYAGMPERRCYEFVVHARVRPGSVLVRSLDGGALAETANLDGEAGVFRVEAPEQPGGFEVVWTEDAAT